MKDVCLFVCVFMYLFVFVCMFGVLGFLQCPETIIVMTRVYYPILSYRLLSLSIEVLLSEIVFVSGYAQQTSRQDVFFYPEYYAFTFKHVRLEM